MRGERERVVVVVCVCVCGWMVGCEELEIFFFFFNFLCDENEEEYIYEKILNGIFTRKY